MKATAADCISDSIATVSVFISTIISHVTHFEIDGYCGVTVSVFIMFAGIKSMWEVLGRIMGKAADKETKEVILQIAGLHPESIFVRNLMVHDYGFGYFVVSMCAEGYKKDREQLYMAASQISYELHKRFHCDCFIQIDYLLQDEALTHTIREQINSLLKKYGNELQVDNFRLIENGAGINIAFNMIYPAEMQKWEEEIRKDIAERIELADSKYHALIKGMIRRERFSLHRKS